MSKILQEKFEVRYPQRPEGIEGGRWASDESARVKKGAGPGNISGASSASVFYNSLPPGMDVEDQEVADIRKQNFSMGGETDASADWNSKAVKYGYSRKEISPTDDMYTREHHDAFYDEIKLETEDGVNTGFLERNNTLDRM